MFLKLFQALKSSGIPVTIKEYLDMLNGLEKGICDSNSVDEFYHFSKISLIEFELKTSSGSRAAAMHPTEPQDLVCSTDRRSGSSRRVRKRVHGTNVPPLRLRCDNGPRLNLGLPPWFVWG